MDIISHGLWGGAAFGRRSKRAFWTAFGFGIGPDLASFGLFFVQRWLGLAPALDFRHGPPDPSLVPAYVHALYDVTHSLVIALVVIGIVWLVRKKLLLVMLAWPLHVLVDIPTHGGDFFPTPFLWPISNFHVDGIPWGNPLIWYPNLALLAITCGIWWYRHRNRRNIDKKA